MRKLTAVVFAFAMILSVAFVGEAASSGGALSVNTISTQVKVKQKRHGVARRAYYRSERGAKKGWYKTKHGTKWTAHKTKTGTKHTFHKIKKAVQ
jgi:hypothetical protein